MTSQPNSNRIFTFYGNMGGDPEERTIEAKEVTRNVYDPVIDDAIEKTWTQPEINFLTYSIATGGKDQPRVWHNCVDWEGLAFRARKGDGVEIQGYFETRRYTNKEGVEKPSARSSSKTSGSPGSRTATARPTRSPSPGPAPLGAGPDVFLCHRPGYPSYPSHF